MLCGSLNYIIRIVLIKAYYYRQHGLVDRSVNESINNLPIAFLTFFHK